MAINDPFMDLDYLIYQLKYDSVHGKFCFRFKENLRPIRWIDRED